MIVCRPKSSVLLSLGTFALLCYGCLFLFLLDASFKIERPSYFYPVVYGLGGLALLLTLRLLFGYKVITARNGKIEVRQKFLFRDRKFDLRHLADLDEVVIKTMNGDYRQLKLIFDKGTLTISKQEYSDYDRLKSYIRQKWHGPKSPARQKASHD